MKPQLVTVQGTTTCARTATSNNVVNDNSTTIHIHCGTPYHQTRPQSRKRWWRLTASSPRWSSPTMCACQNSAHIVTQRSHSLQHSCSPTSHTQGAWIAAAAPTSLTSRDRRRASRSLCGSKELTRKQNQRHSTAYITPSLVKAGNQGTSLCRQCT